MTYVLRILSGGRFGFGGVLPFTAERYGCSGFTFRFATLERPTFGLGFVFPGPGMGGFGGGRLA